MKSLVFYVLLFLCWILGPVCGAEPEATLGLLQRPNIVFIFADDWGYGDISAHGHPHVKTPNLDKMISDGTDYSLFTVVGSVCSPSRAGVMTGQFPARQSIHGHFATVESHAKRGMPDWLDPEGVLLPKLLQNAGYVTGHFGKWHLANDHVPDAPGVEQYGFSSSMAFNHYNGIYEIQHEKAAAAGIEFIRKNKDRPFFLNLWIHESHTDHFPSKSAMAKFAHLPKAEQVYYAVLDDGDRKVGDVMKALQECGIDKKTLVVFSSDNGPESFHGNEKKNIQNQASGFGLECSYGLTQGRNGRKRSLYQGGVGVPFIARWPGVIPAGIFDNKTYISAVDLLPTFCEMAGVALPNGYECDGESVLNAFKGLEFSRKKPIFLEWREGSPAAAVISDGFKLVRLRSGVEELYQLHLSCAESAQENTISRYPEVAQKLGKMLDTWKESLPTSPNSTCFSRIRKDDEEAQRLLKCAKERLDIIKKLQQASMITGSEEIP